eukprot:m.306902 g.306902  ORF g.306902 m.306902 type:complete len:660 (-) comp19506_c0_seq1:20-1999(-)
MQPPLAPGRERRRASSGPSTIADNASSRLLHACAAALQQPCGPAGCYAVDWLFPTRWAEQQRPPDADEGSQCASNGPTSACDQDVVEWLQSLRPRERETTIAHWCLVQRGAVSLARQCFLLSCAHSYGADSRATRGSSLWAKLSAIQDSADVLLRARHPRVGAFAARATLLLQQHDAAPRICVLLTYKSDIFAEAAYFARRFTSPEEPGFDESLPARLPFKQDALDFLFRAVLPPNMADTSWEGFPPDATVTLTRGKTLSIIVETKQPFCVAGEPYLAARFALGCTEDISVALRRACASFLVRGGPSIRTVVVSLPHSPLGLPSCQVELVPFPVAVPDSSFPSDTFVSPVAAQAVEAADLFFFGNKGKDGGRDNPLRERALMREVDKAVASTGRPYSVGKLKKALSKHGMLPLELRQRITCEALVGLREQRAMCIAYWLFDHDSDNLSSHIHAVWVNLRTHLAQRETSDILTFCTKGDDSIDSALCCLAAEAALVELAVGLGADGNAAQLRAAKDAHMKLFLVRMAAWCNASVCAEARQGGVPRLLAAAVALLAQSVLKRDPDDGLRANPGTNPSTPLGALLCRQQKAEWVGGLLCDIPLDDLLVWIITLVEAQRIQADTGESVSLIAVPEVFSPSIFSNPIDHCEMFNTLMSVFGCKF